MRDFAQDPFPVIWKITQACDLACRVAGHGHNRAATPANYRRGKHTGSSTRDAAVDAPGDRAVAAVRHRAYGGQSTQSRRPTGTSSSGSRSWWSSTARLTSRRPRRSTTGDSWRAGAGAAGPHRRACLSARQGSTTARDSCSCPTRERSIRAASCRFGATSAGSANTGDCAGARAREPMP